jgi:hypothetical protein
MYWITSSRRSCSKSTSMSGGSLRSAEMKRSNRRSPRVRVDLGDAEAEADGGVGRRAAALAEDAAAAGEADDVVDGEEIGRVAELGDQLQLVVEIGAPLSGTPAG